MMTGLRDEFPYFQCSKCDCLQICDIPNDISLYYSEDYYSFRTIKLKGLKITAKKMAVRLRDEYSVFNKGIIGKLLCRKYPHEELNLLSKINIKLNWRILDVGCGSGSLLHSLKEIGFRKLLGIDPFIDHDIERVNGLRIEKKYIHDLNGQWDLIMFHHSFEHVTDPLNVLHSVYKILAKGGICLISIPIVPSYAWEHYGINWVQLDAPRHFFLHSKKSLEILAEKSNLEIINIIYNSNEFQFWGSEQYLKGIPLKSKNSYSVDPSKSIFSANQIKEFKSFAEQLNKECKGDSAAFYLQKKEGIVQSFFKMAS